MTGPAGREPQDAPRRGQRRRTPVTAPLTVGRDRRPHPAVLAERERRAGDLHLRIADAVTAFAGSMTFVYLHAVAFSVWMLALERSPWPTLTLVVSLEAIFLSTFVMIGQNRQSAYQQAKAEHDFNEEELELRANTAVTREVHALVQELLEQGRHDGAPAGPGDRGR